MAAPALAVASRRRREIDADLVVFSVIVPPLDFLFLESVYAVFPAPPRSNSSQRRQAKLRLQRNLCDNSAERTERIIHRAVDPPRRPPPSPFACPLSPPFPLRLLLL